MLERKWLPSAGELLDRLVICELKHIFDKDNREMFEKEIEDILHDIQMCIPTSATFNPITAEFLRETIILSIFNTLIWKQEDNARHGDQSGNDLFFTHQANGVRCRAKVKLNRRLNNRQDPKINAIAAEIPDFEPKW